MEEKNIEDEIKFKGQILKNDAKTKLEEWYPLNSEFRIVKPDKKEGFRVEIKFPQDVRRGFVPNQVRLVTGNGFSNFWQESDYEIKNLQRELHDYRIKNSRLKSMIETFWNLHNFRDKHLLMKKVRLQTVEQLMSFLDFNKGVIEDEYGDDDYIGVIDDFEKWLKGKLSELETDFIRESDHWKLWQSEDYEKPVVDLEF